MTGAASIRAYLASRPATVRGSALGAQVPERSATRIYGYDGWQVRWFGLPRIYYGAIGRGLFQTVYSAGVEHH